jgi:hypothetical protein
MERSNRNFVPFVEDVDLSTTGAALPGPEKPPLPRDPGGYLRRT